MLLHATAFVGRAASLGWLAEDTLSKRAVVGSNLTGGFCMLA